jgi:CRISPR/Cas system CSM-associated protein Csm4 (group 5 of RAMP superfamily)
LPLTEIRLKPTGPWRAGHRSGDRERADSVYHSDALYSAVTHAMKSLGWLEEWLGATARAESGSAVRFSSLFPFVQETKSSDATRLLPPPRTAWPPSGAGKLYVNAARLVPVDVARRGIVNESQWSVDGASECLLPSGVAAPFSVSMRSAAAVDRMTGNTEPHRTACLEFAPHAGWWGLIDCNEEWEPRVKSAFRLLADSGFGGERSRGWGRAAEPEFSDASSLFGEGHAGAWWMLSLYSPHAEDAVDWGRGDYATVTRAGWTDSPAGSQKKKQVRMIEEGSVLMAPSLRGRAVDVAPEGFPHPAWRAGFALAVPVPLEVEA